MPDVAAPISPPAAAPVMPTVPPVVQVEPEIHVIPEKYYGAALKQRFEEPKPTIVPASSGKAVSAPLGAAKKPWILIVIIVAIVLAVAGVSLYVFKDSLFKPAAAPVVVVQNPTPAPVIPSTPANLVATSTNPQSVTLSWADTASDESGYRIDRREEGGTYNPLSSLPPNSNSFLDVTVQPRTTYLYRMVALNSAGESLPSDEARAAVAAVAPAPKVVSLPPAGLDTDSDGITDLEEPLYNSDSRNPDTDSDGFLDGNEVFNLYNPAGPAPVRLLDSVLAHVVESPIGWTMSVPASWSFVLSQNNAQATIDTKHDETFKAGVEPNPEKAPILDWYLSRHAGTSADQIKAYRSKGGYMGILSPDLMSAYLPWGDRVFVFTYDLDGQTFINYRTTFAMMLNSLSLSGMPNIATTTSSVPLPFEPSATTSGVVTEPVSVTNTASGS